MATNDAAWRQAEEQYTDEVTGDDTIPRMFEASASRNADEEAQWYKGGIYDRSLTDGILPPAPGGEYAALTYAQLQNVVQRLAAGFRELGLETDDRIGIFCDTRMEWAQSDLVILSAGGVVTTVYTESSPRQVGYLLDDPDADGVVVENEELLERVLEVEDDLDLEFIVVVDRYEGHEDREDINSLVARVTDSFPETSLVSKTEYERSADSVRQTTTDLLADRFRNELTDRQRQILRTCLHGGYFESPRRSTATEIAEALSLTQPTVSRHLRNAQRKLFEDMFERV